MKIKIRRGCFETNSSSEHVLVVCTKKELEEWKKGEYLLAYDRLIKSEKIYKDHEERAKEDYESSSDPYRIPWNELPKDKKAQFMNDYLKEYFVYDTYENFQKLEAISDIYHTFMENYTTPGGEELVIFGYYGDNY